MRFLKLLFLFSIIYSCQEMGQEANYRYPANSDERPMVWKGGLRAFPINLEIANNFLEEDVEAIENAAKSWTESADYAANFFTLEYPDYKIDSPNTNDYRDNKMGIYLLTDWPKSFSRATLAVTQISGLIKEGGRAEEYLEIGHADILVNNDYFKSGNRDFSYDMETVVLHEMGHFLGLIHDNGRPEDTVMFPTISSRDRKKTPLLRDIRNLKQKYNIGMISPRQAERAEMMRKNEHSEGEPFTLILELKADGKCAHFLNGELVHEH